MAIEELGDVFPRPTATTRWYTARDTREAPVSPHVPDSPALAHFLFANREDFGRLHWSFQENSIATLPLRVMSQLHDTPSPLPGGFFSAMQLVLFHLAKSSGGAQAAQDRFNIRHTALIGADLPTLPEKAQPAYRHFQTALGITRTLQENGKLEEVQQAGALPTYRDMAVLSAYNTWTAEHPGKTPTIRQLHRLVADGYFVNPRRATAEIRISLQALSLSTGNDYSLESTIQQPDVMVLPETSGARRRQPTHPLS